MLMRFRAWPHENLWVASASSATPGSWLWIGSGSGSGKGTGNRSSIWPAFSMGPHRIWYPLWPAVQQQSQQRPLCVTFALSGCGNFRLLELWTEQSGRQRPQKGKNFSFARSRLADKPKKLPATNENARHTQILSKTWTSDIAISIGASIHLSLSFTSPWLSASAMAIVARFELHIFLRANKYSNVRLARGN